MEVVVKNQGPTVKFYLENYKVRLVVVLAAGYC